MAIRFLPPTTFDHEFTTDKNAPGECAFLSVFS
jgi:hypothetical protein